MFDHDHLILCRAREETPAGKISSTRRAFEEGLLQLLPPGEAFSVTVVPHLYDLATDGPALGRLRLFSGRLVVLAWLPSRATYWILRNAGVADTPSGDPRRICCLDLRDYRRPEACVESICRIVPVAAEPSATSTGQSSNVEHLEGPVSARWYPVIDYDRCANCLECLNFCLFGVFGLDASAAVHVEQPDACRPGCPACARVCPSGAIMFPEHADPTISGKQSAKPAAGIAQLLPVLDPLRLAAAEREVAKKVSRPTDGHEPIQDRDTPAEEDTRLDSLVDELDEFGM